MTARTSATDWLLLLRMQSVAIVCVCLFFADIFLTGQNVTEKSSCAQRSGNSAASLSVNEDAVFSCCGPITATN